MIRILTIAGVAVVGTLLYLIITRWEADHGELHHVDVRYGPFGLEAVCRPGWTSRTDAHGMVDCVQVSQRIGYLAPGVRRGASSFDTNE